MAVEVLLRRHQEFVEGDVERGLLLLFLVVGMLVAQLLRMR